MVTDVSRATRCTIWALAVVERAGIKIEAFQVGSTQTCTLLGGLLRTRNAKHCCESSELIARALTLPRSELLRYKTRSHDDRPVLVYEEPQKMYVCGSYRSNRVVVAGIYQSAEGYGDPLALRVRIYLCKIAGSATPITYQALAASLSLSPPNTIQQLTDALETLILEDAEASRPLIAALVVSKARGGLPAPGFFDCARRVRRFDGGTSGPDALTYHSKEFTEAVEFWREAHRHVETDS